MKKLTVIGRGTVGTLAVIHFIRHTDWVIDWIYDPLIEPTSVGEGTNLKVPRSLAENIDFDGVDMDAIIATQKMGIWKRNWGKEGDFIHTFPAGNHGMHFSAVEFQKYMFDRLIKDKRVNTIETNSTNHEDIDSDYVMVCTGSPKELTSDYIIRDKIPVNAATVFQCPWDYAQFNYSLTFAKKFGWVFGIPLKSRCSIGYVYNKDLNTEQEVTEDVQDILDEFGLAPASVRTLNFSNYSRRQNYTDRVAYNGNASFFLEPLEATSTALADLVIRSAFDVWSGNMNPDLAQLMYKTHLNDIESMICLHYLAGSVYNTPFWANAEKLANEKIRGDIILENEFAQMLKKAVDYDASNYVYPYSIDVGTWPIRSYVQNIDGMDIRDKLKKML